MEEKDNVKLDFFNRSFDLEFLGSGASVWAFTDKRSPEDVILIVPDFKYGVVGETYVDVAKDVLVKAFEIGKGNKYLPRIRHVGDDYVTGHPDLERYAKIYEMRYYRDIKRSDKEAWLEMKRLHKIRDVGMHDMYEIYENATEKPASMTFLGNKAAKRTVSLGKDKVNKELHEALVILYESLSSFGKEGLTFEFNARNIGLDTDGQVILRDPVYDAQLSILVKQENRRLTNLNNA
jgi:hypothetical protein